MQDRTKAIADEFVVDRYRASDREAVFAFLREVHSGPYAEQLIRQWDWKFEDNPFNQEAEKSRLVDAAAHRSHMLAKHSAAELDDFAARWGQKVDDVAPDFGSSPYVLLLRTGGEIIGIKCTMPGRMRIDGNERWIGLSCDWALHPSFRGRQLAPRLSVRLSADHALEIAWRNAVSVRQGRPETALNRSEPLTPHVKRLRGFAQGWRHRFARMHQRLGSSETVQRVDQFGPEFDEFWQRASGGYRAIGVRDRAYLTWRYRERPDADYTVLAARKAGQLTGFIVLRTVSENRGRRGYLIDFLVEPDDHQTFKSLIRHAEEQLRQAGCKKVEATVVREPFARSLRDLHYRPAPMGPEGAIFIAAAHPDPINEAFLELSNWFLTMGDGDLDISR